MTQHVVIIGAGIVGVSTAIWLQREGHDVTLVDERGPGEGASHGNGGVLAAAAVMPVPGPGLWAKAPGMLLDPRQPLFLKWGYVPRLLPWLARYMTHANAQAAHNRAQAIAPLISDSLADHQALADGTGAERFIVPSDYLYIYDDHAQFDADRFYWQVRREAGFTWDEMDGTALRAYDPAFGGQFGFAARMGNHGRISDPGQYVRALADHLQKQGGRVLKGRAEGLVRSGNRVIGVRIGGETLPCDSAVIAAGAWSRKLMSGLGMRVPLESERGYHLELWEPSVMPRAPVMIASGKFVATPMEGRIRLAGIVEFGGLDAPASRAPFRLLEANIRKAMPELSWTRTVEWMGHRPSMSDSLPVIGALPGTPGAFAAFGHDHVGLTGGPRTGRLLAQMMSGKTPNADLRAFSSERFLSSPRG